MYPANAANLETTSEDELVLRNAGRLSIVPGTSVRPPEAEAMLQVETGSGDAPKLVHRERKSILPPPRPAKPHKPSGLTNGQSEPVSTSGMADPASPCSPVQKASRLEAVVQSSGAPVIATIPQFGDLTSSSTIDFSPHQQQQQQQQQQSSQDGGQSAAQCDTAAVKKRDEPTSLAAGNTSTCTTTERPAKPHKPPVLADGRRISTGVRVLPASPSNPVQRESRLETLVESSTSTTYISHHHQQQQQSSEDSGQAAAPCDTAAVFEKPDEPNPLAAGNTPTAGASAAPGKKPRPPTKKKPAKK